MDKAQFTRFFSKVLVGDGCWEWQNARSSPKGYGAFWFDGRQRPATHWAFRSFVGPIPDGHLVCHRCDNPPCVRPDHLFSGTVRDNALDMSAKGRAPAQIDHSIRQGEKNPHAKLTWEKVREVRGRYEQGGIRIDELAALYGMSRSAVGHVLTGYRWPEPNLEEIRNAIL